MSLFDRKAVHFALLGATGAAWGFTHPLTKLAVSTGYGPLGIMFWQLVIVATISGIALIFRGRRPPVHREALILYAMIALLGTIVPDFLIYTAAVFIPAGILAILMAISPMVSLPIALALGIERFSVRRVSGALVGLVAILLMIGPDGGLASRTEAFWALVVLAAVVFYATQGNFISWYGQTDVGAMRMLFGSSLAAMLVIGPGVIASGQFIDPRMEWTAVEWAVLGTGALHALAYAGYLSLVSHAGPVFASQVSYIVTSTGVLWSMLLLKEGYSGWVWLAFSLVMMAITLVQPRRAPAIPGETAP